MTWQLSIGASYQGPGTRFRVWAPRADQVVVVLFDGNTLGDSFSLQAEGGGYFSGVGEGVEPGTRYMYRLDTFANAAEIATALSL